MVVTTNADKNDKVRVLTSSPPPRVPLICGDLLQEKKKKEKKEKSLKPR